MQRLHKQAVVVRELRRRTVHPASSFRRFREATANTGIATYCRELNKTVPPIAFVWIGKIETNLLSPALKNQKDEAKPTTRQLLDTLVSIKNTNSARATLRILSLASPLSLSSFLASDRHRRPKNESLVLRPAQPHLREMHRRAGLQPMRRCRQSASEAD